MIGWVSYCHRGKEVTGKHLFHPRPCPIPAHMQPHYHQITRGPTHPGSGLARDSSLRHQGSSGGAGCSSGGHVPGTAHLLTDEADSARILKKTYTDLPAPVGLRDTKRRSELHSSWGRALQLMTPRERRRTLPLHNEPSGGKVGSEPLEGSCTLRHILWQGWQTGLHDPNGRSNVLRSLTPPETGLPHPYRDFGRKWREVPAGGGPCSEAHPVAEPTAWQPGGAGEGWAP
ncbi:hypothetical protein Q7C36_004014 [Tachysurus vachellii]|uniref:Uncharacterized protein n=1 Tax=Tachysurus vachellii TaxID=175792 RepID=A0AA88NXA4_TACVA|nr:hypothetical protein Q7C36_004014 [Tachysurus vachellii]